MATQSAACSGGQLRRRFVAGAQVYPRRPRAQLREKRRDSAASSQSRIEHGSERTGQRRRIARRRRGSPELVVDNFGDAANRRRHHGPSAGQGLDQHVRMAFGIARQRDQVRTRPSSAPRAPAAARRRGARRSRSRRRAPRVRRASDRRRPARACSAGALPAPGAHRVDEFAQTFFGHQASDIDARALGVGGDAECAARAAARSRRWKIDASHPLAITRTRAGSAP